MLESRNFVIFLKFIWQHTKFFEKSCISETLRGQRSESGIFTKSKAVDISLMICHGKVFPLLFSKRHLRNSDYLI